jgi:hypothetical protein
MAVITMEDLKTRLISNRRTADPSARQADWNTLLADTAESFGDDKVDLAVEQALMDLRLE